MVRPARTHGSGRQAAIAVAAAGMIGLLDAALVVTGTAGARGAFEYVPARIWIVAPLAWLGVMLAAGAPVLLITRRRAGVSIAISLAVILISIRLRSHPPLLIAALAGGAAVAALLRRTVTAAAARRAVVWSLLVLPAAALVGAASSRPRVAVPAPVIQAPADGAPNVIVIFLDTVRYDAIFDPDGRVHGDLPTLAALRAGSTVFTRAYATSSWTLPSHLSAVTGLPAHELGMSFDVQTYTRDEPTLAERFRQRGYRTAAVISNSFLNRGSGFARGYDRFEQAETALDLCRTAPGVMLEPRWPWFAAAVCNWTAGEVTRRALGMMADDERPYFLTLNYMDAHDPYYVGRECAGGHGYREAVRCLDRHLGPVLSWQSSRRPTMVALLSDHGELFGEHGLQRHGNGLQVQLLHVPMLIRSATPRLSSTDDLPVSIAALPRLLGIGEDSQPGGEAVLALLHPPAAEGSVSQWSALDDTWHLIVRDDRTEALYHLANDPAERHNLSGTAAAADPRVSRLRSAIEGMRRSPRPDARRFRSLGYIH
jgi:arylsulfatase A-like enzyme